MRSRSAHRPITAPASPKGTAPESRAADVRQVAREYLYIEDLAALTPWSRDAIETMVRRGILRRGVHYFQPGGHRGRLIFKWSAIVSFIQEAQDNGKEGVIGGQAINVEEATRRLRRLLG